MRIVRDEVNSSSVEGRLTNTLGLEKRSEVEVETQLTSSARIPPISMKLADSASPVLMSMGCASHQQAPSSHSHSHSHSSTGVISHEHRVGEDCAAGGRVVQSSPVQSSRVNPVVDRSRQ
jgi:hypothetical protein